MGKAAKTNAHLRRELIRCYDKFTEYRDLNLFFYQSIVALAAQQDNLDDRMVNGIYRYGLCIQLVAGELEQQLKRLVETNIGKQT